MRVRSSLLLALILIAGALSGCGLIGDEVDVRGTLWAFFDAARQGNVAAAIEHVAPEQATAKLLAGLKESDPAGYEKALEEMGGRLREALEGVQLHVASVVVRGKRAILGGLLIREGKNEREFVVEAVKHEGKWLLATLPITELD